MLTRVSQGGTNREKGTKNGPEAWPSRCPKKGINARKRRGEKTGAIGEARRAAGVVEWEEGEEMVRSRAGAATSTGKSVQIEAAKAKQ